MFYSNQKKLKIISKRLIGFFVLFFVSTQSLLSLNQRDLEILNKYKSGLNEKSLVSKIDTAISLIKNVKNNNKEKPILHINNLEYLNIYKSLDPNLKALVSLTDEHTKTFFGKIENALAHDIKQKTVDNLKQKRNIIKELLDNENLFKKLDNLLEEIKEKESNFLNQYKSILEQKKKAEQSKEKNKQNTKKNFLLSPVLNEAKNIWKRLENNSIKQTCLNGFFAYYFNKNNFYKEFLKTSLFSLPQRISFSLTAKFLPISYSSAIPLVIYAADLLSGLKNKISEFIDKDEMISTLDNFGKLLNSLKKLELILSENELLKKTYIKEKNNIKKTESISTKMLEIIQNESFRKEIEKDTSNLELLYKTFLELFTKNENIETKNLVLDSFSLSGKIDHMLALTKLCKANKNCNPVTKYVKKRHIYIRLSDTYNPLDLTGKKIKQIKIAYWLKEFSRTKSKGFIPQEEISIIRIRTLLNNLILAHMGISFAEKTILTPISSIITTSLKETMPEVESFKSDLECLNSVNMYGKNLLIINNKPFESPESDNKLFIEYKRLLAILYEKAIPMCPKSFWLFSQKTMPMPNNSQNTI